MYYKTQGEENEYAITNKHDMCGIESNDLMTHPYTSRPPDLDSENFQQLKKMFISYLILVTVLYVSPQAIKALKTLQQKYADSGILQH